jgi:hypothetical protein
MTHDESKSKILARRARFVAIAMASAGLSSATQGCGGTVDDPKDPVVTDSGPEACLSPPLDASGDAVDEPLEPCLSPPADADMPEVQACLQPPPPDAEADVEPQPCLDPPMDAGFEACLSPEWDGGPAPCLSPPEDAGDE